jgi:hypothetical protein
MVFEVHVAKRRLRPRRHKEFTEIGRHHASQQGQEDEAGGSRNSQAQWCMPVILVL